MPARPALFCRVAVLAALLALAAAPAPAAFDAWDFVRATTGWARGGLSWLFAPQGSLTDPNGRPEPEAPFTTGTGAPDRLFAPEGGTWDPNGRPAPVAAGERAER